MNNNFDKENKLFSNSNDSYANNNHYLSNGIYLNPNANKSDLQLLKSSKALSISYIVICLILFIFIIACSVVMASSSLDQSNNISNYIDFASARIVLLISFSILGFILFMLSIVLAVNFALLYKIYYCNSKYLFMWFLFGIFLIPSFVGSILALVYCKKIRKNNFQFGVINNSEYLDNKDYNHYIQLFKICKELSISYIILCSILFIFIIVGSVFSANNSPWNNNHVNSDNFTSVNLILIISGSILGFVLLILSIIFTVIILFLKRSYSNIIREDLFLWFLFGILLIPSFIGSILTIINIDKIEKQLFDKKSIDKITKKVLNIVFAVIGLVTSIIGVGLIAGTYDSYSNYQLLVNGNLNYWNNFNASYPDPSGVIAGSILLTIGLVTLIISGTFLGIIIEKEKKEKNVIIH